LFLIVASKFLDVDDRAVGDSANAVEPLATFALQIFGAFGFAAQKKVNGEQHAAAAHRQCIKAKWIHDLQEETVIRRQRPSCQE
jgi:hypothetical protein